MFAKFNLKLKKDDLMFNEKFHLIGHGMFLVQERDIHTSLDKYLSPDGRLDAAAIELDWFPSVNAQVFLSHSHKDKDAVLRFAGFLLQNYGITSFIDSTVWGYANNLLKQIDKPVFHVDIKEQQPEHQNMKVIAFAGIGYPQKFYHSLQK